MLYLNQVLRDMPGSDLPRARSPVDRIFICVLAAPDRETAVGWYRDRLGLERGADFTIPYTMINQAFDLPPETKTTLTMVSAGRMPIVEVDDYPESTTARPLLDGHLPPGNALVTLAVRDFDACDVEWIAQPARHDGAPYDGRRAGATRGPGGRACRTGGGPMIRLLLALLVLWPAAAQAEQPSAVLERAIEAHGGDLWLRPGTLRLEGRAVFYAPDSATPRSEADDYRMWRVFDPERADAHEASGKVRIVARAGKRTIFRGRI